MQNLLDELPPDIEQVFQTLLNRDMDNKHETILAIQWILFSERPIQPVELFCAVQVGTTPKEISPWDTSEITSNKVSNRIIHSSKGLIERRKGETTLQFIHLSVNDGRCRNVLQILALNGYIELVRVFSHCTGFDANAHDGGYYGNALQAAVIGGHPKMVSLLLDLGANVNAKAGKYGYALQAAAWQGNKEIVGILLRHGANVHAQGGRYGSAHRAAEKAGKSSILKMLDTAESAKAESIRSSACIIL